MIHLLRKFGNNDIDLRTIPGYDKESRMFFLPSRIVAAVRNIVNQDSPISNKSNLVFVYIALAMANPTDTNIILRYLRFVQKTTPTEIIDLVDRAFVSGWDASAIKNKIIQVFGR